MKEIARGAEAAIFEDNNAIVKDRIKKSYRATELDEKLRRERTRNEAKLLNDARRAGVDTPKVLQVDEKNNKIVMEKISGQRIKDFLNDAPSAEMKQIAELIGSALGKLHLAGIVHGDATTSNMILHNGRLYLIDFGLGYFSNRAEDFGTDLAVLQEAIRSTHFEHFKELWHNTISAYEKSFPAAKQSLKALQDIESRGRYMTKLG